MTAAARIRPTIRFRGRSFLALVLAPVAPVDEWIADLDVLGARSPGFFAGRPVILDLSAIPADRAALAALIAALGARAIRVMAVEGAAPDVLDASLPPAIGGGRDARSIDAEPHEKERAAASLMLEQPVRSGQTIANPHGDVIVLGHVGSGAEIIAGGSIHIYGALRGRAIAGTTGNTRARIFCRKLEAELMAIDGLYTTADSMDPKLRGRAVQAWLSGDTLHMTALD